MKIVGLLGAFLIITGVSLPGNLLLSYANDHQVLLRYANENLGSLQSLNDFNIMKNNNTFNVTNDVNKGLIMTTGFGQASSVYLKEQMAVDQTSPGFSTYFVMNVYKLNASSGDGYTFIIAADSNSLGSPGGGLGYAGIRNSVAVEFDFHNGNGTETIASSDVFTNGDLPFTPGAGFDSQFTTKWNATPVGQLARAFHTWIEYDFINNVFEVRVVPSNHEDPSINRPVRPSAPLIRRTSFNLPQVSQFFYAGFSAATGGAAQMNGLKSWYFSNAYVPGGIDVLQPFIVDNEAPTAPTLSLSKVNDVDQLTLAGSTDNIGVAGYQFRTPTSNWIQYEDAINLDSLGTYQARSFDRAGNVSTAILVSRFEIIYYINNTEYDREIVIQQGTTYVLDKSVTIGNNRYTQWYAASNFTNQPLTSVNASSTQINIYGKPFQFRFSLNYQLNGGTVSEPLADSVELDALLTVPLPTKEGHTFTGWFTNNTLTTSFDDSLPLNKDTILHARWTVNKYTFTVISQFQVSPIAVLTLDYNSTISALPTPSQVGYTFEGWYEGDTEITVGFVMPARDVTLQAKWTALSSTVIFVSASNTSIHTLTSGETIGTLPTVESKEGYTFLGWSLSPDDPSKIINDSTIIENGLTIRLYPVWVKNTSPLLTQPWIQNFMNPTIQLIDILSFTSVLILGGIMLALYVRKQYGNI